MVPLVAVVVVLVLVVLVVLLLVLVLVLVVLLLHLHVALKGRLVQTAVAMVLVVMEAVESGLERGVLYVLVDGFSGMTVRLIF